MCGYSKKFVKFMSDEGMEESTNKETVCVSRDRRRGGSECSYGRNRRLRVLEKVEICCVHFH